MYRSGAAAQRLLAITPLVQTGRIASPPGPGVEVILLSHYREVRLMAHPQLAPPGDLEVGLSAETVCRPTAASSRGRPGGVLPLRELRDLRGGDVRGLVLRPQVCPRLLGRLLQGWSLPVSSNTR